MTARRVEVVPVVYRGSAAALRTNPLLGQLRRALEDEEIEAITEAVLAAPEETSADEVE